MDFIVKEFKMEFKRFMTAQDQWVYYMQIITFLVLDVYFCKLTGVY